MKKILFFLPSSVSIETGILGTEKNAITLINEINRKKYQLSVAIINIKDNVDSLNLKPNKIHNLNSSRTLFSFFRCYSIIKKEKPDIVFSFMHHINIVVGIARMYNFQISKFIARESNIPSLDNKKLKFSKIHQLLYKLFYKNYDVIVCQSKDMQRDILSYASVPKEKTIIIPNAIDVNKINQKIRGSSNQFNEKLINVLAVGRLTYQKGFDMLLKAFSLIKISNFHLTIIGMGPNEKELKNLTNKLQIGARVTFLGFKNNPYKYMAHADVLAFTSRYEGFPNVLLESCATGLPVVAFNCPGGINEIIKDGINGFKVEVGDIEAFAKHLIKVSKMKFNSKQVVESVKYEYELRNIINQYEKTIDNL